jgi:hypothetical protein
MIGLVPSHSSYSGLSFPNLSIQEYRQYLSTFEVLGIVVWSLSN